MGFTASLLCLSLLNPSWHLENAAVMAHAISLLPIKHLKGETEGGGKKWMHERATRQPNEKMNGLQPGETNWDFPFARWQCRCDSCRRYSVSCWRVDCAIPKAPMLPEFFSNKFCKWAKISFKRTATNWMHAIPQKESVCLVKGSSMTIRYSQGYRGSPTSLGRRFCHFRHCLLCSA